MPDSMSFSHCILNICCLFTPSLDSFLFSVYDYSELVAFGAGPRSNVHRLMIPPTILGCRIFQAHDVSKLCGLVFFAVVTGHCWRRRPVASCWGREAGRRLWVIHLVGIDSTVSQWRMRPMGDESVTSSKSTPCHDD